MSAQMPWMKFWKSDWMQDHALRAYPAEVRAVWIDLLCIFDDSPVPGHLMFDEHTPVTAGNLAPVLRMSKKKTENILEIFQKLGRITLSERGVYCCEKLVQRAQKSDAARASVSRRWSKETAESSGEQECQFADEQSEPHEKRNTNRNTNTHTTRNTNRNTESQKKELEEDSVYLTTFDIPASQAPPQTAPPVANAHPDPDTSPPAEPLDARTALFRDGLRDLRAITGQPDSKARAFIGRMLAGCDDDAHRVHTAIRRCADTRPADPTAWLAAACNARAQAAKAATARSSHAGHDYALAQLREIQQQRRAPTIDVESEEFFQ